MGLPFPNASYSPISADRLSDNEGETGSESSEVENGDREDRPAICGVTTRGGLIDPKDFPEQDLRLHIGICGAEINGEPVLEAGLFDRHFTSASCIMGHTNRLEPHFLFH